MLCITWPHYMRMVTGDGERRLDFLVTVYDNILIGGCLAFVFLSSIRALQFTQGLCMDSNRSGRKQ
jgi:hypothetical protein